FRDTSRTRHGQLVDFRQHSLAVVVESISYLFPLSLCGCFPLLGLLVQLTGLLVSVHQLVEPSLRPRRECDLRVFIWIHNSSSLSFTALSLLNTNCNPLRP